MSERDIFMALLDLPTAAERAKYLDTTCGSDADLRRRVEKLLGSHEAAGSFLDLTPASPSGPDHAATRGFAPDPEGADTRTGGTPRPDDEVPLGFLAPSARPDSLGRIGHYEVLQVLGQGGFGIVLRAFDEVLQRVVAVKVLSPQMAATSPARKRFIREARTSAQVRHENVVRVYEVGEEPLPYLVMEFIPGETLQQRLDRVGPVEPAEVVRVGRQIADGLAAAHVTDLIHRDIKPGNILLEGGTQKVKLTDFGLARAADDASISQSGIIAGTPMYMAPEQAKGEKLDQRADLFSLGSVLYQMAAGRPPFRANTTVAVLKRVAEDTPRDIREITPETPQWLCDIISRLHAKDPDDRFQSAREVADLLADCEDRLRANARPRDLPRVRLTPSKPGGRRTRLTAAALVLLPVVALTATELAGVTHWIRGETPPPGPVHADTRPTPPNVEAPKADSPPALRLVFDHSLAKDDALDSLHVARGQYASGAKVLPGTGLLLHGGHTTSAVWPKVYLGDWYRVQFEAQVPDTEEASWVLSGPGYGNSRSTGYLCAFTATHFWLLRTGQPIVDVPVPVPFRAGDWVAVEAEFHAGKLTVALNGMSVVDGYTDVEPLMGPLHGWLGLHARVNNVIYRNLRIWSSAAETQRSPTFTPPVTVKPLPNGKLLYQFQPAALDVDWFKTQPTNVSVEQGALVLDNENNGQPHLVLEKPLAPADLACDVELEYSIDALNFGIYLFRAERPPRSSKECDSGWQIRLPAGDGQTEIRWHQGPMDGSPDHVYTWSPVLASMPYYTPVPGRRYQVARRDQR
jgi:serine/threonine protein kinase